MSRDDIISFLDRLRKPESVDLLHKWQGSYSNNLGILIPFFKWLYYSNKPRKERPIPDVIVNIAAPRRKEISTYKPTDLWTEEDDLLSCKYCSSKRDRAFHMVARDTGCRPGELLDLRIKDLVWINTDTYQVAQINVHGKRGNRTLPVTRAIPWLKDWLTNGHPFPQHPNAPVFCGDGRKNTGRILSRAAMNAVYRNYQKVVFPRLLQDPLVEPEDKSKIEELLKTRKWNPYTRRHTALTEISRKVSGPVLHQFASWSPTSKMAAKYLHYFGNEAFNEILELEGIKLEADSNTNKKGILKPRVCSNCDYPNKPGAEICANPKCRHFLTTEAYLTKEKEAENTKKELEELKTKMDRIYMYFEEPPAVRITIDKKTGEVKKEIFNQKGR